MTPTTTPRLAHDDARLAERVVEQVCRAVAYDRAVEQGRAEERQRRDTLRQRRLNLGEVLSRAADFYRTQLKASPCLRR